MMKIYTDQTESWALICCVGFCSVVSIKHRSAELQQLILKYSFHPAQVYAMLWGWEIKSLDEWEMKRAIWLIRTFTLLWWCNVIHHELVCNDGVKEKIVPMKSVAKSLSTHVQTRWWETVWWSVRFIHFWSIQLCQSMSSTSAAESAEQAEPGDVVHKDKTGNIIPQTHISLNDW